MSGWAQGMLMWSLQSLWIVALVMILTRIHRSSTATTRHSYWLIALAVIALLPAANAAIQALPARSVPSSFNSAAQLPVAVDAITVQAERAPAWRDFILPGLFALWIAGVSFSIGRVCRSYWLLQRSRLRSRHVRVENFPIPVAYSNAVQTPVLAGFLNPSIELPESLDSWTNEDERHVILLHELAHLQRGDQWVSLFSALLGSIFFFHPAVRFALKQLISERELACDERVLASGAAPSLYADVILKVAEHNISGHPGVCPALNAAGKALERRLEMILRYRFSGRTNHWQVPAVFRTAAIVVFAAMLLPERAVTAEVQDVKSVPVQLAEPELIIEAASLVAVPLPLPKRVAAPVQAPATAAPAQAPSGRVSGTVVDQSGAVVPGVAVALSGGETSQNAITNEAGAFAFPRVPPGNYSVQARLPGFQNSDSKVIVRDGQTSRVDMLLSLRGIQTVVEVSAQKPSTPPEAPPPTTLPQRVGGDVAQANLISATKPVYPARARANGIQGVVNLIGVIGANGTVLAVVPDPTGSSASPDLVHAAIDAVKQWRYKPQLLNGTPIDIVTTISVNFTLVD